MAVKAEKFIIALQAQYEGSEQVKALQTDLDALGSVEKLQKFTGNLATLTAKMGEGATASAKLKTAMDASFDPALAARLEKTKNRVAELSAQYTRQKTTLDTYASALSQATTKLASFSAQMSDSPSAKERAELEKLSGAVAAADGKYVRYQQTVGKTSAAMGKAQVSAEQLTGAVEKSVDPKIASQYRKQNAELTSQQASAAKLRQKIDELSASLTAQGVDTSELAAKQRALTAETTKSGEKVALYRTLGMRSFADVKAETVKLTAAWGKLDKSQMSVNERFAAWSKYRQKIAGLRSETSLWSNQVGKLQQGWAGVIGIIGTLRIGQQAITEFATFDDAMLKVQAVSRGTEADFLSLKKTAQELGATTRFSSTEAAQGMSELASTGMTAHDIIATLPGALDMAAISGMGVKDSADKMTDIMSQFGLETEKAGQVVDILTQGYTGASTSMQELAGAMTYVGPVASSLGMTLESTTAILQALAEAGYKNERAGTALRGGFTRLINPSTEAAAVLENYKIQVMDATGEMRPFADIIGDIGAASLSSKDMIKLFGQEAGPGMMALVAQGGDAIKEFEAKLQNVGGVARDVAGQMESGIGGSLRKLFAAISSLAISFGDTFAPVISMVAGGISSLASEISALPSPVRALIGIVGGATTAFALWRMGIGLITTAVGSLGLNLISSSGMIARFSGALKLAEVQLMSFNGAAMISGVSLTGFRGKLLANIATLPVFGNLLASNVTGLLTFSGAATKAGAALRLLNAAGLLLASWEVGKMVGGWLNQFALVRKFGLGLTNMFIMLGLRAKQAWAWVSGGDTGAVAAEIEAAKKTFDQMYKDIETGADLQKDTNAYAQEEITRKIKEETEKQKQLVEEAAQDMAASYASADPDVSKAEKKDEFGFTADEQEEMAHQYDLLDQSRGKDVDPEALAKERAIARGEKGGASSEEKEGSAYNIDAETERAATERNSDWAKQLENTAVDQAIAAINAGKNTAASLASRTGSIISSTVAPEKQSRAVEQEKPATRTVEIKLGNATLRGSEDDADDFLSQLQRAGLLA